MLMQSVLVGAQIGYGKCIDSWGILLFSVPFSVPSLASLLITYNYFFKLLHFQVNSDGIFSCVSYSKTYKTISGLTWHTNKVHNNGTSTKQQTTLLNLPELFKEVQNISNTSCYPTHITDKIHSCTLVMVDSLVSEINNIQNQFNLVY